MNPASAASGNPPPRHRLRHPQWQLAVEILDAVLHRGRVADASLQDAFRARPAMGSRDRALVGELVFGVLRDLRRLRAIAQRDDATALAAVQALRVLGADVELLHKLGVADAARLAVCLRDHDEAQLTPAQQDNVPDDVHRDWCTQYGEAQARALAHALQASAPVDLRVNTLKADRAQVRAALAQAGIDAQDTPRAPMGLRLARRAALQATVAYREGWFEPQDEGSQLLALLVQAMPDQRIADYCAGAGGKTLALAASMQDRGELWAMDIDAARLARLAPRLRRAGVHCVRIQPLQTDIADPGGFDAVLVDAPCSGSGTWRRQPDGRLRMPDLRALGQTQRAVLTQAARLPRPGGRLVYATCSLLSVENDAVVDDFLAAHPQYREADAGAVLAEQGVDIPGRRLRLLPHLHGTDGFFAAVLERMH